MGSRGASSRRRVFRSRFRRSSVCIAWSIHELGPALRAWLAVIVQRALFVAILFAPLVGGVWLAADALAVSPAIAWGVVLPIAGIAMRFVWLGVVHLLAKRLDRELVDGVANEQNPWHAQVHGYLRGYLARANIDVDETLIERMRFYPGRDLEAIHAYAGRVVIGRAILERALAPYGRPHDFAMPRVSTLHWTHWNSGLVMATESDQKLASREDRNPSKHATVDEGVHERVALGEPPTFTGVVEPVALDGRTFYRPGDDPAWLNWDPGEEFDGTDAGDKDFLFGVLVLAMGAMQRHEDRGATFSCCGGAVELARRSPASRRRSSGRCVASPLRAARCSPMFTPRSPAHGITWRSTTRGDCGGAMI